MLNLVEHDIYTAPIFVTLPKFESIYFQGFVQENVQLYEAINQEEKSLILATMIIRQEERFLWDSSKDLIARSIKEATNYVSGIYSYDLISFDIHRELDSFNDHELSQMIVNHARKLTVGQQRLIKYSSCFGLLKKLVDENWGQITFLTSVDIYYKQPSQMDLLIKRLQNIPLKDDGHKIIIIHDISQAPILNEQNGEQKKRLIKRFGDQLSLFDDAPEVYIYDKNTAVELMEQLRSKVDI